MLDRIEDAIEDIRKGKLVIVVDDEDRENEGDFIVAAEFATPEVINFMSKEGRGLICVALTEERCATLQLAPMVTSNTSLHETAFTVSVDLIGEGTTTGISAQDRSKTILALVNPNTRPDQLGRPGHIFPLKAVAGGVLRRTGHTEATIDLARLAGLQPAGALVEVMNEDADYIRKTLPKTESRYFVSNLIVEKMFDNITVNYKTEFNKLQNCIEKLQDHLSSIQRVVIEKRLPSMERDTENLKNQSFKLS
jgi:3,4-dihydroxy-2-butanone 4-phosphate synthase